MTDQELKDLVAGLAVQHKIDAAENKKGFAALRRQSAKTDAQIAKNEVQFAKNEALFVKNEAQFAKTDAQFARTDAKLERMGIRLGNMAENHGYVTEDYFFSALSDTMKLGGIKYDDIAKNIHVKSKRLEDEFDLVMYNGNSIALIECKYKAHKKDVVNLMEKKVANFRSSHPDYESYKIYLGIASFSFYDELEEFAKENGIAILKQKGDVAEIEDRHLKIY